MSEASILKDVLLALSEMGVVVWRVNTGLTGELSDSRGRKRRVRFGLQRGGSDIIGIVPTSPAAWGRGIIVNEEGDGLFLAIEVKQPGKKLTIAQRRFLDTVNRNGGIAFRAESADQAKDLLTDALMNRGLKLNPPPAPTEVSAGSARLQKRS